MSRVDHRTVLNLLAVSLVVVAFPGRMHAESTSVPPVARPHCSRQPGIMRVQTASIDRTSGPIEDPESRYALAPHATTPIGYHGEIEKDVSAIGQSTSPNQANRDPAAEKLAYALLSVDRTYAAAAAPLDVIDALSAKFDAAVIMPTPARTFAKGRGAAVDALRSLPDNATPHVNWTPVRAGISGDGQHGFTYGYVTLYRTDSSKVLLKNLAYWIKRADGWKVAAYKRGIRPEGEVSTAVRPSSLPDHFMPGLGDDASAARFATELASAERAFSDEAGRIGLGPAFKRNGAPDDKVIVAACGDLGVTVGYINAPDPQGGEKRRIPFFTIWKRANPMAPWQYVAE